MPINWVDLRRISDIVQRDLDAYGLDEHEDYESVFAMWEAELADVKESSTSTAGWYTSGAKYWEDENNCPPNDQGVLGGYGHISPVDVEGSSRFLDRVQELRPGMGRQLAIDCGCGVGRVVKNLLLPRFDAVDCLEQCQRLLNTVPSYIGNASDTARIRNLYCMGMQDFQPEAGTYDLIWCQWVLGHLTDSDFVEFMKRCQAALAPNGVICIKENAINEGAPYYVDKDDSSLGRSPVYYKSLFRQAGLTLVAEAEQSDFPDELYPVVSYALY
ncbi:hypothetical protein, variant [Aphanomyces invadans]|uniref:Alpha N-terminal protein methyltransferase 1 n=1 Tax=Aphanomyces invadans TaxID=157072 RepID=A0A024TW19_9STRA|nr:hypothetical protein, variant [Aphanomyces invadans]ETV98340.1 hypothetical protein, variant [Aphanomyces invadans]|eukprot:XP_008873215.1 hypothetical protein, variant [Aphanomyces invadans]